MLEEKSILRTTESKNEILPIQKLKKFLEEISIKLRSEYLDLPINDQNRINMALYKGDKCYSCWEKDMMYVQEKKKIFDYSTTSGWDWHLSSEERKKGLLNIETCGKIFEALIIAVLHKNLPENYMALGSSEYDDIRNGVDIIILNKNTSEIVCALDGFVCKDPELDLEKDPKLDSEKDLKLKEKKAKIFDRNYLEDGISIRYGIYFKNEDGKTRIEKKRTKIVPLYLFACPIGEVKKMLENFSLFSEGSLYEEELFDRFIRDIGEQNENLLERISPYTNSNLRPSLELTQTFLNNCQNKRKQKSV